MLSPTENSRIQGLFMALEWFSSTFQGRFNFQGLFMESPLNSSTFQACAIPEMPFQISFSSEISHSCSSSPVCILNHVTCWIICTFKCCFLRKRFPQTSHLNGFSPVCIRQCDFIWARFLSARPQLVQIYALPGSVEHLYHGCASETKYD